MSDLNQALQHLRSYYNSGATRSLSFRKTQLQLLQKAIYTYEKEIALALYSDLKKSPEEAYASETGLVLAELRIALKNLHRWMRPEAVPTNLVNLPSTSKIYRDSLGVVLIIGPWNYPLQLLLIPLIGAIAGGNCVLLKPSELSPATTRVIEKMITEVFAPGHVTVVTGEGAEIVPALMKNFRFDHVFFTGSLPVGRSVYQMAAEKLVPVTLELGGKSPAIVHANANISVAAKRIAFGKFLNTGQTCIAPDYVLVHKDIKDTFISALIKSIKKFYADPASNYNYGKIINEKRFDTLVGYLGHGDIIIGGEHEKEKLFIAPTVLQNVIPDSPLMHEEIFGPLLPLVTFSGMEDAMDTVQRNPDPLSFYLFTRSKKIEDEWIQKISFGGGCINNTDWHFANHNLPFGGLGNSGMGAYHGKYSFTTFTRAKAVMKTPNWFDPSLKYPPLKGKLKIFRWLIR